MKIKTIRLENVKCFSDETISLEKEDTGELLSMCALVGANGAGKSTILKSVVATFSVLNDEYQGELFTDDAVSCQSDSLAVSVDLVLSEKEMEYIDYDTDQLKLLYMHFVSHEEGEKDYLIMKEQMTEEEEEKYKNAVVDFVFGRDTALIMYYDPFRFVSDKNPEGPNLQKTTGAKDGALASNLDKSGNNLYRDLGIKQWIMNMDYRRLKEPSRQNLVIYNHMIKAFDLLLSPLVFDTIDQEGGLIFRNAQDNQKISIDMLSDGFKSIFSIVLDIIRRLASVTDCGDEEDEEFYMKEAVILIDEIDCHIHPKWQRKIIPALRELFPNCQFIFTTHSPYILDGLQMYEIKKVGEKDFI